MVGIPSIRPKFENTYWRPIMSISIQNATGNQLLVSLPDAKFRELQPHLERIKMKRGDNVYKIGESIPYVYFPESCIISMITVFEDGTSIESGLIGREGMTGITLALSDDTANREAYVQVTGSALRVKAKRFCEAMEGGGPLQRSVMNYTSTFFEQVIQTGACSSHHSLNERLARLLLMCNDRTDGNKVFITHEFIAQMLGTYRPNVTNAAVALKEKALIDYRRGLITITDKKGLENAACECYKIIKKCYKKYLSSLHTRSVRAHVECVNPIAANIS
jgi:CRP-like cAMP-binding protein